MRRFTSKAAFGESPVRQQVTFIVPSVSCRRLTCFIIPASASCSRGALSTIDRASSTWHFKINQLECSLLAHCQGRTVTESWNSVVPFLNSSLMRRIGSGRCHSLSVSFKRTRLINHTSPGPFLLVSVRFLFAPFAVSSPRSDCRLCPFRARMQRS